jgi:hypothetical protein
VNSGALDPVALLATLSQCGVDFVVIGAMAVGVHAEVRSTGDVDIMVPAGDQANKRALEQALSDLEAVRVTADQGGIDPAAGEPYPTVMFRTRFGKLDVLYRPDGSDAYPHVRRRAAQASIGGHPVAVAGKDDLVRMKLAAGRPEDLRDVAALTAADRGRRRRHVLVSLPLAANADPDWARDLTAARVEFFDPNGRVWAADDRLHVDAARADLTDAQLQQWAQALADRLHGAGVLADRRIEIEIDDG